jgi:uncharacterized membrane protein YhaH (DUF805 family)
MGFIAAVKFGFIRYFTFTTRSSRSEFWWWILFTFMVDVILVVVNAILFGPSIQQSNAGNLLMYDGGGLGAIFQLVVLIPTIAISCRRLHDIDKSGWWQLLIFIPLIGWGFLLYWFVKRGDDSENRFGANPLVSAA